MNIFYLTKSRILNDMNISILIIKIFFINSKFQGTPFVAKAYDARLVAVGGVTCGGATAGSAIVGGTAHFTVDASQAGEGNLEITISARGLNIPTQVHPQVSIINIVLL